MGLRDLRLERIDALARAWASSIPQQEQDGDVVWYFWRPDELRCSLAEIIVAIRQAQAALEQVWNHLVGSQCLGDE